MKKLLILPVIALFTLSSFTTAKVEKGDVTLYTVYYHCNSGDTSPQTFLTNNLAEAQSIANYLCNNR